MEDRNEYIIPISKLIPAIQAAAINDFPLQVIAAGSMYATLSLTQAEIVYLQNQGIFVRVENVY